VRLRGKKKKKKKISAQAGGGKEAAKGASTVRDAGIPVAARVEREGCSPAAGGRHGLSPEAQTLPNPKCNPGFPPVPPLLLCPSPPLSSSRSLRVRLECLQSSLCSLPFQFQSNLVPSRSLTFTWRSLGDSIVVSTLKLKWSRVCLFVGRKSACQI
jgi:hypothetical protein